MKRIELSGKSGKGKFALVDDADYEGLCRHKWYLTKGRPRSGSNFMSRQIMNSPEGKHVDHINHNQLDNRRSNLRICTQSQNNMNRRGKRGAKSKYKGVSFDIINKNWRAQIMHNGNYIGKICKSEIDAARAYDELAKTMHGEYAYINFPTPSDRSE